MKEVLDNWEQSTDRTKITEQEKKVLECLEHYKAVLNDDTKTKEDLKEPFVEVIREYAKLCDLHTERENVLITAGQCLGDYIHGTKRQTN